MKVCDLDGYQEIGVLLYDIQWSIGHFIRKQAFIVVGCKLYDVTFRNIEFHQPAVSPLR